MKITIIGGGNMGGAIARGAVVSGAVKAAEVTVADPSDKVQQSFREFNAEVNLSADNAGAVSGADLVFVAVKPWLVETVMGQIAQALDRSRQMVVCIAAGITFETLKQYLGGDTTPALFRVIPNTAISLGQSTTFVCSDGASEEQLKTLVGLLDAMGRTFVVREDQMTALTALASCGIAYIFRYIDAAVRGGEEMGVPRSEGLGVVMQTVKGALAMLEHNGSQPQEEIDKVTTPGGITLKGLEAMEKSGFTQAVIDGLKASR